MKEQTQEQHPVVVISNNQAVTTTLEVARYFGKRHDDVLKAIKNLECSPEFRLRNFAETNYLDSQGRKQPAYEITRDGFVLLAMGFTGSQAMRFKESYISAFNKMEDTLRRIHEEALIEQTKREALNYFRKGAALTALLQQRDILEKVEKYYWCRVHGNLTHYEAAQVCHLEYQHADEIARTLREIGLAMPIIQGQVRRKEISHFFSAAVGGFLPSDIRMALADLRREEVAHV